MQRSLLPFLVVPGVVALICSAAACEGTAIPAPTTDSLADDDGVLGNEEQTTSASRGATENGSDASVDAGTADGASDTVASDPVGPDGG